MRRISRILLLGIHVGGEERTSADSPLMLRVAYRMDHNCPATRNENNYSWRINGLVNKTIQMNRLV
jgi:hypothetical protein